MTAFVKSLINDLDQNFLKTLDTFVDMDDETLVSIKKKESLIDYKDCYHLLPRALIIHLSH